MSQEDNSLGSKLFVKMIQNPKGRSKIVLKSVVDPVFLRRGRGLLRGKHLCIARLLPEMCRMKKNKNHKKALYIAN